ncbi:MAG: hypothetical protein IH884_00760 [Myxococcales bacterium]|nr:hypothetical protein [Myxococcales bacterium]
MTYQFLRLVPIIAIFALLGCASAPGGGTIQFSSTGSSTAGGRAIIVNVDANALQAERRDVFLKQAGTQKIAEKVFEKLAAANLGSDRSPDVLDITVNHFRLRSGSTGFWLGAMAGADKIAVSVHVKRRGKVTKTFSTDTSTAVAGIIRPGSVERFNRMVNTLAQRIVDGI